MGRRKEKRTDSEKLDLILGAVSEINEKVDKQNEEIEILRREVLKTQRLVDEMAHKNRRSALIAGGIGGSLVTIGFELMRAKLGM